MRWATVRVIAVFVDFVLLRIFLNISRGGGKGEAGKAIPPPHLTPTTAGGTSSRTGVCAQPRNVLNGYDLK